MKKFAFLLMVAGVLSMVACKSTPKQQEEQPAQEQIEQEQTEQAQTEQVDTTATVEAQTDSVPAAE